MRGRSAVDLARDVLAQCGSLSGLFAAERSLFQRTPGLGDAKYAEVQAVLEMSRRALREALDRGAALSSPQTVRDYLRLKLQGKAHEIFVAVFLDAQNRVIEAEELFRGTLTQTSVFPREIVKRALHYNAAAVIFAHNHPSGVAEPSRADEALTQTLKHTLALVDVRGTTGTVESAGDRQAFDRLLPLVYADLRRIASRRLRGEDGGGR